MNHLIARSIPASIFCLLAIFGSAIAFSCHPSEDPLLAQTESPWLRIKAVGDIMPGTNFPRKALPPGNGEVLFKKITPHLSGADILFGNFESTLTNYPKTRKNTNRKLVFAFRTPPAFALTLKNAGFDVLSVANNHSFDFYPQGFADTQKNLRRVGILPVGEKGTVSYLNYKGTKIAFIGFAYYNSHNNLNNKKEALALIRKARSQSDFIIISVHAGAEGPRALHIKNKTEYFYRENRGNLMRFSRDMIDNGADLIIGHGPHVIRAVELYKDRLIAYSLGNFIGYLGFNIRGVSGLSFILSADLDSSGRFLKGRLIPVQLKSPGIPEFDPKAQSIRLIQRLMRSDIKRPKVRVLDSGEIVKIR